MSVRIRQIVGTAEATDAEGSFRARFTATLPSPMSGEEPRISLHGEETTSGFGKGWYRTTLSETRAGQLRTAVLMYLADLALVQAA